MFPRFALSSSGPTRLDRLRPTWATAWPCSSSHWVRRAIWVERPEESGPSMTIKVPESFPRSTPAGIMP